MKASREVLEDEAAILGAIEPQGRLAGEALPQPFRGGVGVQPSCSLFSFESAPARAGRVVGALVSDARPEVVESRSQPRLASWSQAMATWPAGNIRRLRSFQQ
jgi:hypothetical protein